MSDPVQEPQSTDPVASTPPAADPALAPTPSADPSLSAGSPAGDGGPSAPSAPTADPRAEIDALATRLGFEPADLANYQDVASAQAAIRSHLDQVARSGLSNQAQPAPQQQAPPQQQQQLPPQQQQPAPVQGLDLASLGLSEDDPAAKAIRAIESQVTTAQSQVQQVAQVLQQVQNDSSSRNHQRLVGQAEDVIAGFKSPEYGIAGHRTASQEWNTQRLFDLTDALAHGANNAGRAIPSLSARLNQAMEIDLRQQSPAIGGQPVPAPPAAGAPVNVMSEHSFVTNGNVEPMGMTDSWSSNPELMRLIADAGN